MTTPDDEVIRRLERLTAVEPGAEATARALERARSALVSAPIPRPSRQRRALMVARIAAGILLLAVGTSLLGWFLSPRADAGLVFAEVQEKVQKTRSMTCTMTTIRQGKATSKDRILLLVPNLTRFEGANGTVSVMDFEQRKAMLVEPAKKKARIIQGMALENPIPNVYDLLRTATQDVVENLPERTIDGKKAVGFRVRLSVGERKEEASVWVDPQTKLPLRMEMLRTDKEGREEGQVMSDFVFDAPLDASLFRMTPPEGYEVETSGVATDVPPPKDPDLSAPVITPGVGIGPARFGMSKEEVIKVLGEPDSIPAEGKGMILSYLQSRGYQLHVTPQRGLVMIICVTQKTFFVKVRDFSGKTKEGIGMGATEKEVEQAYGKPDSRRTWATDAVGLSYNRLGIDLTLHGDKLLQMMFKAPPPAKKP
jgi:outer membrane lipoprotein-sorting protein